ncbi:ty3-gypsy retrotransposon protein [Cucumis melo var. makuwa]|uniref:Ty3-gypsy retrotransposon protein n=1 Tax=Cucumis melo var. makuwa TaxID=1194695 RepID=A0A5D3BN88_CUCMM|nr:ty3-gypsy retrotransposon protein [Cucumis melo var. makuwa]TYK00697.1 ty3-gypsy retrotransposon protein [Cucumis melo var. makuwa]
MVAPLFDLPERVVEDTFMNGLLPWVRVEVVFLRPKGLAEMMEVTQMVENREIVRIVAKLSGYSGGKLTGQINGDGKVVSDNVAGENKGNTSFPIRTITLRSSGPNENRREGSYKRLSDAEFQARKEKGSGAAVQGKGICEKLEVQLNNWKIIEDFLPLDLGGVDDVILVNIKGDPSLTKARISHKNMIKNWGDKDAGFLIECRSIEVKAVESNACCLQSAEVLSSGLISSVINQFQNVFEWSEKLPPRREIEHHIHMKERTNPINVRPYRYGFHKKEEMEKLVKEMLNSGLLKKGGFRWTDEATIAFDKLKSAMLSLSVLALPDFNQPFETETDAFGFGPGQCMKGSLWLLYWRYKDGDLYLLIGKFKVKTDQKALKFLLDQRIIQPQYQKWIAKLLGYSFEVVYKPGAENKAADALSRKPAEVHLFGLSVPITIDLEVIKKEVFQDPKYVKIVEEIKQLEEPAESKYSLQNGMLMFKNRLVILKNSSLIPVILDTFHNSVIGGHSGFLRTYKRVAGELYWDGMKADIKKHCEECLTCQRSKSLALSPSGLLVPLEIPQSIWSDISMDFVEGLPKFSGFEVILVVVDRLKVQPIILNRTAKLRLSTKEWVKWLPRAEYWYNTTFQWAIGMTPFQFVYGRQPPTILSYGSTLSKNSTVEEMLQERDTVLISLREHLRLAQEQMKVYADRKRRNVKYCVGDYVFLRIRPYRQATLRRRRNEKLSPRFFGPYKIVEKVGPVAYRLELPESSKIHLVFHVSQLRKLVGQHEGSQPTIQFVDENYVWKSIPEEAVEYRKTMAGQWEVLVCWEGLPKQEATWESYDEMQLKYPTFHLETRDVRDMIEEFLLNLLFEENLVFLGLLAFVLLFGFFRAQGTGLVPRLGKAYIDFEISEHEFERTRELYERLLDRTKHLKVWISYAKFEASAMEDDSQLSELPEENMQEYLHARKQQCIQHARRVFEKAITYYRNSAPELKEERAMLLEEWLNMETSFGELGDVSLVQSKLPKKLKKRRQIVSEDGPAGFEEYIDYLFPEETQTTNLKILEAAYRWKKQKKLAVAPDSLGAMELPDVTGNFKSGSFRLLDIPVGGREMEGPFPTPLLESPSLAMGEERLKEY